VSLNPTGQDFEGHDEASIDTKFKGSNLLMNVLLVLMLLILVTIVLALLVLCNAYVVPRCCSCMQAVCQYVKNRLMYNSVIRGLLEAYFLMSLSALYQVRNATFKGEGLFNFVLAVLTLLYLLILPCFSLWFLFRNFKTLETPRMLNRFGTLY